MLYRKNVYQQLLWPLPCYCNNNERDFLVSARKPTLRRAEIPLNLTLTKITRDDQDEWTKFMRKLTMVYDEGIVIKIVCFLFSDTFLRPFFNSSCIAPCALPRESTTRQIPPSHCTSAAFIGIRKPVTY